MRKYISRILWLFLIILLVGCDNNSSVTSTALDGLSLLGLVDGRTLTYLQTDTTITVNPFNIEVTTSNQTIKITGSGDDWIIHNNNLPLINLKIASSSIIQNGYWRKVDSVDSIFYFATPPIIIKRSLSAHQSWQEFTPMYQSDSSQEMLPFYYAYFGFYSTKEYADTEEVLTPAGGFNAYRYDIKLYMNQNDETPIATVSEFYVPHVGLVQWHFNSGPLKSTLTLINYTDPTN